MSHIWDTVKVTRSKSTMRHHRKCKFLMFKDIDECTAQHLHKCTHTCVNTNGSYRCQCPMDMELADDMKTCTKIPSIYNTPQHDNPQPTTTSFTMVKYAQMVCADGFILEDETCLGKAMDRKASPVPFLDLII